MIYLYRIAYFILSYILIVFRFFLPTGLRKWIELREFKLRVDADFSGCYWFHAASGEIEYCKAVIRELKHANPKLKIVVSYSSPSAERLFKNIAEHVDLFFPLPWDRPAEVSRIVSILKPKMLIFSRTDFWPELILAAKKRNVKLSAISFMLNPNSGAFQRYVLSELLRFFDFISSVDESSHSFLKKILENTKISADGDTRFDQVFYRLSQNSKITIKSEKPYIVFGSTWPEDEAVIYETLLKLKDRFKIIFSPHEVAEENILKLEEKMTESGLKCIRLGRVLESNESAGSIDVQFSFTSDLLLVDRIGYLADCYRSSSLAFVGGSFRSRVHSVMEPLCCGNHVLVGPKINNSPEAVRYVNKFVHVISDSNSLLQKIEELATHADRNLILNEMSKNKNASSNIAKKLLQAGF